MQDADPMIAGCHLPHRLRGPVRGVVVDEDDLPGNATECPFDSLNELADIFDLIEGGNND
jgi:hypothetical protein